jgi:tetratricopeptide (TPR) repeat protein
MENPRTFSWLLPRKGKERSGSRRNFVDDYHYHHHHHHHHYPRKPSKYDSTATTASTTSSPLLLPEEFRSDSYSLLIQPLGSSGGSTHVHNSKEDNVAVVSSNIHHRNKNQLTTAAAKAETASAATIAAAAATTTALATTTTTTTTSTSTPARLEVEATARITPTESRNDTVYDTKMMMRAMKKTSHEDGWDHEWSWDTQQQRPRQRERQPQRQFHDNVTMGSSGKMKSINNNDNNRNDAMENTPRDVSNSDSHHDDSRNNTSLEDPYLVSHHEINRRRQLRQKTIQTQGTIILQQHEQQQKQQQQQQHHDQPPRTPPQPLPPPSSSSYRDLQNESGFPLEQSLLSVSNFPKQLLSTMDNNNNNNKNYFKALDATLVSTEAISGHSMFKNNRMASSPPASSTTTTTTTATIISNRSMELISFCRKVVQFRMQHYGSYHTETAIALLDLGEAQSNNNEYATALSSYRAAYSIYQYHDQQNNQKQNNTKTSALVPSSSSSSSSSSSVPHQYHHQFTSSSSSVSSWSYRHWTKLPLAKAMDRIGVTHSRMGMNLVDALKLLHDALSIRYLELGPCHVDTIDTLNHLSTVHLQLHHMNEARQGFAEVFLLRRAIYGYYHPSVAVTAHDLGNTFLRESNVIEAITFYRVALYIYHQLRVPRSNPSIIRLLRDLDGAQRIEQWNVNTNTAAAAAGGGEGAATATATATGATGASTSIPTNNVVKILPMPVPLVMTS